MIIGSFNLDLKIGSKIEVSGPRGRLLDGSVPAIVLRKATKQEYSDDRDTKNSKYCPPEEVLNRGYFYEVSID